ncbi:MAG: hypothetical protein IMF08_08210 [Proteobacteria bacterium]|nr:hypothetical protein [Pseudomonadota bacterium]
MSSKLPVLLSAVAEDAVSLFLPIGGNTVGAVTGLALEEMFRKRQEQAREILLDELRKGDKRIEDAADVDEMVSIVHRYGRAAQEGTARLNLRLMAKVIAGKAHLGNLVADEFLYYADLLSSLRREEVILAATLHRFRKKAEKQGFGLVEDAAMRQFWSDMEAELIPSVFENEKMMRATALAVGRTGLVMSGNTMDSLEYFTTSPLMDKLEALASFDEALREEGVAAGTGSHAEG